jgi:hypothetical protein
MNIIALTGRLGKDPELKQTVWRKEMPQGQPQKPPQVTAKLQELPTDQPFREYRDDEDIPF